MKSSFLQTKENSEVLVTIDHFLVAVRFQSKVCFCQAMEIAILRLFVQIGNMGILQLFSLRPTELQNKKQSEA